MATRIQICGPVVVQVDGQRVDGALPGRQGLILLVYLAANQADHEGSSWDVDPFVDPQGRIGRQTKSPVADSNR